MNEINQLAKSENRSSIWLLIFSACYALFHICPPFLNIEIKHKFMIGELFDLFTPFVIIFIIFKLYEIGISKVERSKKNLVKVMLILGTIFFIEGHGMHLSSNAIFRHLDASNPTSLVKLTYFFDEILGHILWDSGVIFLSIGLILIGFFQKEGLDSNFIKLGPASILFGFTFFVNAVEGQTVIFTFPFAVMIIVILLVVKTFRKVSFNSFTILFLMGYGVATALFVIWWLWQGGFPQFSELRWI